MQKFKIIRYFLTCLSFIVVFSSCKKEKKKLTCSQDVIISKTQYETALDDQYSIIDLKINGDCLTIKFSASGCNGNSWTTQLIDAGGVAYSFPPQRSLKLSLDNKELCEAIVTKEISFNIKDLQVQGTNKVLLKISGQSILYEY
jgi:hypothetical protein